MISYRYVLTPLIALACFAPQAAAATDISIAAVDPLDEFAGLHLSVADAGVTAQTLTVTNAGDVMTITDPGGITYTVPGVGTPGDGACTAPDATHLECTVTNGITEVTFDLLGGTDTFNAGAYAKPEGHPLRFEVSGGPGNDTITTGAVSTTFGSTSLALDSGNDTYTCGSRDNSFDQDVSNDGNDAIFCTTTKLAGYDGTDTLSYGRRSDNIVLRLADSFAYAYVDATGEFDRFDGQFGGVGTGSGNDDIRLGSGAAEVGSSAGNDVVWGSPGGDEIWGGAGDDEIHGGAGGDEIGGDGTDTTPAAIGNDTLYGDAGNDNFGSVMEVADGGDDINGGTGTDTVSYVDRQVAGVTASIDNIANDGEGGATEGDNIHADIEQIKGSRFADTLRGDASAEWLYGNKGNDTIFGNAGGDHLYAGTGFDALSGGRGNDLLVTRDGHRGDTAACGAGAHDRARVDARDARSGCELLI